MKVGKMPIKFKAAGDTSSEVYMFCGRSNIRKSHKGVKIYTK